MDSFFSATANPIPHALVLLITLLYPMRNFGRIDNVQHLKLWKQRSRYICLKQNILFTENRGLKAYQISR
jgi:hypothetical protein